MSMPGAKRLLALSLPLALVLAGCNKPADGEAGATDPAVSRATAGTDAGAAGEDPAPAGFDIDSVPISDKPLGDFPYLTLPAGYVHLREPGPVLEVARAPLWTGSGLEWVEGRVYMARFKGEQGKAFSPTEVERNIGHIVEQAGGVVVASGMMPPEIRAQIPADVHQALLDGLGPISDYPAHTWVVRRADRTIWIHMSADTSSGAWMVAESAPFVATASLLPASQLQSAIDSEGRVTVQVNFATDQAEILPESQPQVDEIIRLLQGTPELRLRVDGHTDNTGVAARNQALSAARAEAVVAALVARGIDAVRLQAAGHGDSQPVAGNDTEEGKARNRRVELVKV